MNTTQPLNAPATPVTAWDAIGPLIERQTGRRLVGTDGGLYVFDDSTVCVPTGDVEGAVHELCHWVVASDAERRQDNHGLSADWRHPEWRRMVEREERAWSLELWLFGEPTAAAMVRYMTPESVAGGGGGYTSTEWAAIEKEDAERERRKRELRARALVDAFRRARAGLDPTHCKTCDHEVLAHGGDYVDESSCVVLDCDCTRYLFARAVPPTLAARVEAETAWRTVLNGTSVADPAGAPALRDAVLREAERVGLPVRALKAVIAAYRAEHDAARARAEEQRRAWEAERDAAERAATVARLAPRKVAMLRRADIGTAIEIRRATTAAELDALEASLFKASSS